MTKEPSMRWDVLLTAIIENGAFQQRLKRPNLIAGLRKEWIEKKELRRLEGMTVRWDAATIRELTKVFEEMKSYDTTNVDFHNGTLFEHDVWTAMVVWNWIYDESKPEHDWIQVLPLALQQTVLFAAAIHDLGKMGAHHEEPNPYTRDQGSWMFHTIPNHPEYGRTMLMGSHAALLASLPDWQQAWVRWLVAAHWELGNYISSTPAMVSDDTVWSTVERYRSKLEDYWSNESKEPFTDLHLRAMIVLSAADVAGASKRAKSPGIPNPNNLLQTTLYKSFLTKSKERNMAGDKYAEFDEQARVTRWLSLLAAQDSVWSYVDALSKAYRTATTTYQSRFWKLCAPFLESYAWEDTAEQVLSQMNQHMKMNAAQQALLPS
jgi:hypothetical protein